jgi:hypothetical protein
MTWSSRDLEEAFQHDKLREEVSTEDKNRNSSQIASTRLTQTNQSRALAGDRHPIPLRNCSRNFCLCLIVNRKNLIIPFPREVSDDFVLCWCASPGFQCRFRNPLLACVSEADRREGESFHLSFKVNRGGIFRSSHTFYFYNFLVYFYVQ